LFLKVCREFDDITSAGKLFNVRAAATGNDRLPTVDSCVDETSNAKALSTGNSGDRQNGVGQVDRSKSMDALVLFHDTSLKVFVDKYQNCN